MTRHRFSAKLESNGAWTIVDGPLTDGPIYWSGLTGERARLITQLLNSLERGRAEGRGAFGSIPSERRRAAALTAMAG